MRGRKALINTITGMAHEVVTIICGLILPRLVLSHFGSSYNGITSSITQFLAAIALMKAGIGGVTRAALYKPLANGDTQQISSIVNTTERFMRKIAGIFLVLVGFFACIYPIWVEDEFSWLFAFSLILILSISTFAQYFFGITYQMVLHADQRQSSIYLLQIVTTILNTVIAAILIGQGCSIHVVKLASALIFGAHPLIINAYVRKKYKIDKKAPLNNALISQRWDAFGQQLAFFVHNGTDLMVLTIFSNLYEVSVYTVYNYALRSIREIIVKCVSGFEAAFGNMYAKREMRALEKNLKVYELVVFSMVSVAYAVTAVMIVPYAMLYTSGVNDVNYARPVFAMLVVAAGAFSCFRIPYKTITDAVGHFKQTRTGALVEAGLNIAISIVGVIYFGIVGVAFGTLVATIFRSVQYACYLSRNIIPRNIGYFVKHVVLCLLTIVLVYLCGEKFILGNMDVTVISWVGSAIIVTIIAMFLTVVLNLLFFRREMIEMLDKTRKAIWRRGRKDNSKLNYR